MTKQTTSIRGRPKFDTTTMAYTTNGGTTTRKLWHPRKTTLKHKAVIYNTTTESGQRMVTATKFETTTESEGSSILYMSIL